MSLSRRDFLQRAARATAGIAAVSALGFDTRTLSAGVRSAGNPLRIPPEFVGGDLAAAASSAELWTDATTSLLTVNGSYPSPTIRVQRGAEFAARLVNNLDEPTILHWHGILAPSTMDGHPRDAIQPGSSRKYRFTVNQRAGTYWYHPHPDMRTGLQVYSGMAGFFIVHDDVEEALALPSGAFDVPLMLQDRRVTADRQFEYIVDEGTMLNGMLGETTLVNGTPNPVLDVSRDLYRFRVLNGSNARVYRLAFDDASTFHLIGTDGGLIDAPVPVSQVWLAPGERIDILLDFSGRSVGQSLLLRSLAYGGAPDARTQGWPFDLLRFDITAEARGAATLPQTLSPVVPIDPAQSGASRNFFLATGTDSGGMLDHTINGEAFDIERVDLEVVAGTVELWTFRNFTGIPHPMHLHGASFQVQTRNNSAASVRPEERGWKDTVLVEETGSVDALVQFGGEQGLFLLHCHNLEHEDHGMMSNIQFTGTTGVEEERGGKNNTALAPNPASESTTLSFSSARPGTVVVNALSLEGRNVAHLASLPCDAGRQSLHLDLHMLQAGPHLIELVVDGVRTLLPLTVVR